MGLQNDTHLLKGKNLLSMLNCLHDYLQQHGALGKPFDLLRGLTNLTIKRAEKGEDLKISSTSLQVEVDGALTEKSPGSALAAPWKQLNERILLEREQGIQEFFAQHGFDQYLWPVKDKSLGGAGNPSMYYLETRVISTPREPEITGVTTKTGEGIRYIPELTPSPAWWLKKLLERGYALQGWRRWLLIGFGLTNIILVGFLLIFTYILFVYSSNLTFQKALSWGVSAALFIWISYSFISPLIKLLNWRIIKAPDFLVSLNEDNVLIELVRNSPVLGESFKVIRLVRYAGTCPICTGKVEILEGKNEFPNRFVGRCQESPAEHVYSFDRITLHGKLLR